MFLSKLFSIFKKKDKSATGPNLSGEARTTIPTAGVAIGTTVGATEGGPTPTDQTSPSANANSSIDNQLADLSNAPAPEQPTPEAATQPSTDTSPVESPSVDPTPTETTTPESPSEPNTEVSPAPVEAPAEPTTPSSDDTPALG